MSENHTAQINGTLAAFAFGALTGIGLALLYAPHTGKETREMLTDKSRELKDKAQEFKGKAQEIKGKAEEKLHEAQDFIGDRKDKVIAAVKAGKAAVVEELHKINDEVESLGENESVVNDG